MKETRQQRQQQIISLFKGHLTLSNVFFCTAQVFETTACYSPPLLYLHALNATQRGCVMSNTWVVLWQQLCTALKLC